MEDVVEDCRRPRVELIHADWPAARAEALDALEQPGHARGRCLLQLLVCRVVLVDGQATAGLQ
eukprot:13378425-Alexandrium_andersonii.AAC.1